MIQTDKTLLEYTDWKSWHRWADAVRHVPYCVDGASGEPLVYLITNLNFFFSSTAFFFVSSSSVLYVVSVPAGNLCGGIATSA